MLRDVFQVSCLGQVPISQKWCETITFYGCSCVSLRANTNELSTQLNTFHLKLADWHIAAQLSERGPFAHFR